MAKRVNASVPQWVESEQRWVYRVTINGLRKAFTSSNPSDKAGPAECRRKYNLFISGQPDPEKIKVKDAWSDYLEDIKLRKGDDSNSFMTANQVGKAHILPKLGREWIRDVTDQDWQKILYAKPQRTGRTIPLSRKTLMNIRGEIMLFAKYLKKRRLIDHKPEDLEIPAAAEYQGRKILTPQQLVDFLLDDDDSFAYLGAWQLACVNGLRPGEAYGVQDSDVVEGVLDIKRAINARNKLTGGKNKNAQRDMLETEISGLIIARQQARKARWSVLSPWLFPDRQGGRPNARAAYYEWEKYRKVRGLDGVSPYSMRHTFVSYVYDKEKRKELQKVLGHAASMQTERYKHITDADKIRMAEVIDDAFSEITTLLKSTMDKKLVTKVVTQKKEKPLKLRASAASNGVPDRNRTRINSSGNCHLIH